MQEVGREECRERVSEEEARGKSEEASLTSPADRLKEAVVARVLVYHTLQCSHGLSERGRETAERGKETAERERAGEVRGGEGRAAPRTEHLSRRVRFAALAHLAAESRDREEA